MQYVIKAAKSTLGFAKKEVKTLIAASSIDIMFFFLLGIVQYAFVSVRFTALYSSLVSVLSENSLLVQQLILEENKLITSLIEIEGVKDILWQALWSLLLYVVVFYVLYVILQSIVWYLSSKGMSHKKNLVDYAKSFSVINLFFLFIIVVTNIIFFLGELSSSLSARYAGDNASQLWVVVPQLFFVFVFALAIVTYYHILSDSAKSAFYDIFKITTLKLANFFGIALALVIFGALLLVFQSVISNLWIGFQIMIEILLVAPIFVLVRRFLLEYIHSTRI